MNGPRPDLNPLPQGTRYWRAHMKSGETWFINADELEPTGSLGLVFRVAGVSVAVLAYSTFAACEQVGDYDTETPYVRKLKPPERPQAAAAVVQAPKEERKIRRQLQAATYVSSVPVSDPVRKLLAVFADDEWSARATVREAYKETYGGFPPVAYKAFNEAVELAKSRGLVETSGDD